MLLKFSANNYKSFRDGFEFSMIPAPKQKGLDYSVQDSIVGGKKLKTLSSAVIYGPNASGKSNIIGAMDTMKTIVLRGNIKNSDSSTTLNVAACALELIPYNEPKSNPVSFAIQFIEQGLLIDYSFTMDIGAFLDKSAKRKIIEEYLAINEKTVFKRKEKLEILIPSSVKPYLNDEIFKELSSGKTIATSGLNDEELFLMNGYKSIFAKKLVAMISDWFEKKFIVIYHSDAIQSMRKYTDPKENTIYIEKTITDAAKIFGINSNALGYRIAKDGTKATLYSIFDGNQAVPSEYFESYGTIRFINEFPIVIEALANGGTLVMDEFDASIHPMAIMSIINVFHNDETNINHAQLIFNTHNPIFLNSNLFRRDEIKFVDRNDENHISTHYSLSDFKTTGERGVRKGEDYMKNYFVNQYGAIKEIDFAPILEGPFHSRSEVKND